MLYESGAQSLTNTCVPVFRVNDRFYVLKLFSDAEMLKDII